MNTPYYKVNNAFPYEGYSDFFYGKENIEFFNVVHEFEKIDDHILYITSEPNRSTSYVPNTTHHYKFGAQTHTSSPIFSNELNSFSYNGHVVFENGMGDYYFSSDFIFDDDTFPHILNSNKFATFEFADTILSHRDIIERLGSAKTKEDFSGSNINAEIMQFTLDNILNTQTGSIYINDIALGSDSNDVLTYEDGINNKFTNAFFGYDGDDTIYGSSDDLVYAGQGDDLVVLSGGRYNDDVDIVIYNIGDGNDTIEQFAPKDTIFFGEGIEPDNLLIERPNLHDLQVSLGNNQSILLKNFYNTRFRGDDSGASYDAYLKFVHHDAIKLYDVMRELTIATPESGDTIYGYGGGFDLQVEGGGDDLFILTSQGSDTVSYSLGDGNDTINLKEEILRGYLPNGGVIINLDDINFEDIDFEFEEHDITMHFEDGGSLLIEDAMNYPDYFDEPNFYIYAGESWYITPSIVALYNEHLNSEETMKNQVIGTEGRDTLLATENPDYFDGLGGFNIVSYENSNAVKISLIDSSQNGLDAQGDKYHNIDLIRGSAFNDQIKGDAQLNFLDGMDGNDQIFGGGGRDFIDGGFGDDALYGQNGDDELSDFYGNNTLDGGAGTDTAGFYDKETSVYIDLANPYEAEEIADNNLLLNIENIIGSLANDTIKGDNNNNKIDGYEGDDFILGRGGDDTVYSYDGNDTIYGQSGNDSLISVWGEDVLNGGSGADTLIAGDGEATLIGGTGNDVFSFQAHNFARNTKGVIISDYEDGIDLIKLPDYITAIDDNGILEANDIFIRYHAAIDTTYVEGLNFIIHLNGNHVANLDETDFGFA